MVGTRQHATALVALNWGQRAEQTTRKLVIFDNLPNLAVDFASCNQVQEREKISSFRFKAPRDDALSITAPVVDLSLGATSRETMWGSR